MGELAQITVGDEDEINRAEKDIAEEMRGEMCREEGDRSPSRGAGQV